MPRGLAPRSLPRAHDNIAKSSLIPDTLLSRSSLCGRAAFTCTSVGAGEQHGSSQDPHATGGVLWPRHRKEPKTPRSSPATLSLRGISAATWSLPSSTPCPSFVELQSKSQCHVMPVFLLVLRGGQYHEHISTCHRDLRPRLFGSSGA